MTQVLGLVTARGGSKGIPRKNLLPLGGKPLIAWTIETAMASSKLDRVVVSTDDLEIAQVSREFGAEVPFLRPAELSNDDSPHVAAVVHALRWLESDSGYRPDYVLTLQPTSPLRTAQDIEAAIEIALDRRADAVVGVQETHHHPYLVKRLTEAGALVGFIPTPLAYPRRQDLPPAYFMNGAIYLTRRDVVLNEKTFLPERTFPYVMPPERSLQIDSAWDLRLMELVLEGRIAASIGE